ncbi:MAG: hypothetical protein AB7N24_19055 [Dehalococcoidia bacterium]
MRTRIRGLLNWLSVLPTRITPVSTRRRKVLAVGAVIGFCLAVPARIWMRTISKDHVFTVPGTMLILIFFSAMGALVGLVSWWRRRPNQRPRSFIVRAAGLAPFALLGPFILLFIPSFFAALVSGHPSWRKRWRRLTFGIAIAFFAFTELILLTMDVPGSGGVRLASGILYLPLAYALFLSNRVALDPLPRPPAGQLAAG